MRLGEIAHARSGDKGNHANIGVIPYDQADFEFLKSTLTTDQIAGYFQALSPGRPIVVECYELPGIGALNFVLWDVLAGGASQSLRIDNQGKCLAVALLEMELPTHRGKP